MTFKTSTADSIQLLLSEAEKYKMKGDHLNAIKVCESILYNDLHCVDAFEEIGDNYLSLRKYEEAKKALLMAVELNPMSANANYLLGFVFSAMGNWKKSIQCLEKADSVESNHSEILRCMGWSIFHNGQHKRGIILLERALALKPNDLLILSDLGICYLNEKNFKRAAELFEKILSIDPNDKKALECLNAVRFFQKEFKNLRKK